MPSSGEARMRAGVEDPEKLETMQNANRAAAAKGRPGPHLSLDLDKPPPHKTGNMFAAGLQRLFGRDQHPEYVKSAARKLYYDGDDGEFAEQAKAKLLAYTAAHTAPIQGMGGTAEAALLETPAPNAGWFKGTVPHADKPFGHDAAPPKIETGLVLETRTKHPSLGHLIRAIGDQHAQKHIRIVFNDRFEKEKQKRTLAAMQTLAAMRTTKAAPYAPYEALGGRRPRRTRKAKRHTRKATRNRKSRVRRSRRKLRTRRN